jgi:hypothetical protein
MSGSSGLPAPLAVAPAAYFDATAAETAVESPRELGFWSALALVIGSMVGSGVFLLPASLAAYRGLSLAGWLISAAGSVALALVFARLARHFPAHGGIYAYSRRGFGDTVGFLVAWGYWLSIVAALAALAVAGVGYLDPFVPDLTRTPAAAGLAAVAVIWAAVGINVAGVGLAGRVQIATTVLKLVPLVVVGLGGLAWFDGAALALPDTTTVPAGAQIIAVVTLTLFAFQGLECATIPAGRVIDPARTIPRATVWGTVATAAVYIVCTVGVMSLVPPDTLARSTAHVRRGRRPRRGAGRGAVVPGRAERLGAGRWTIAGRRRRRRPGAGAARPTEPARHARCGPGRGRRSGVAAGRDELLARTGRDVHRGGAAQHADRHHCFRLLRPCRLGHARASGPGRPGRRRQRRGVRLRAGGGGRRRR